MELLFETSILLCLTTFGICMQLPVSFDIKSPINFGYEVESLDDILPDDDVEIGRSDFPAHDHCFCFPNNSNSKLITEVPELKGLELERLVIYLYKNDGLLQVFIPNKEKQASIPDLTFDENRGDVLKTVQFDSIGEIYDSSPSIVKQQTPQSPQSPPIEENESDITDEEPNEPQSDREEPKEDDNDIFDPYEEKGVDDIPSNEVDDNISLENNKPSDENNDLVDEVPNIEEQNELDNNSELENTKNSEDINTQKNTKYDNILSMLPPDARLYLETLLSQLQNPEKYNGYFTFDNWFEDQLMHNVLQNVKSPSSIKALRQNIIEILKNNGLYLLKDGFVIDSNGELFNMANIKMRPILIGDLIEYQNIVNQGNHNNHESSDIPYRQMILITLVSPPRVLGVVPVGRVYLPKNMNTEDVILMNDEDNNALRSGIKYHKPGCKSCKFRQSKSTKTPFNTLNALPYYVYPLPKNIKNRKGQPLMKRPSNPKVTNDKLLRFDFDMKKGLGNLLQNVLGMTGRPKLRQRLLGGKIDYNSKPGEKSYPNNDLGLRIVGGNPATSSGTPVVSKGRSGYLKTII